MAKEYWSCTIGPVNRLNVPYGGDWPLRMSVKSAFEKMMGTTEYTCSSGWGRTQETADLFSKLNNIRTLDPKHFEVLRKQIMNYTYGNKSNENNTNTDNLLL